jgi:hypothetical protein
MAGLTVISGGRDWAGAQARPEARVVRVEDVEAEARRRLRAAHIDEWRAREFITGKPAPADIKHLELQITFAALAISRLSPIPADYASDVYWPTHWTD